ncbi:MerR family transcriptional regulator [Gordoniibacillus kamchatkensis]|nr:MerR family transcriptional regulator [Paenibacillus sp. VKM B-2647]
MYTIRDMARQSGRSADTLRYYEKIGLLDRVRREPNGYRAYSDADLAWIAFLDRLRATGMSIADMTRFAELRRQGDGTVAARRELLEKHEAELTRRLQELEQGLAAIRSKIEHYSEMERKRT